MNSFLFSSFLQFFAGRLSCKHRHVLTRKAGRNLFSYQSLHILSNRLLSPASTIVRGATQPVKNKTEQTLILLHLPSAEPHTGRPRQGFEEGQVHTNVINGAAFCVVSFPSSLGRATGISTFNNDVQGCGLHWETTGHFCQ